MCVFLIGSLFLNRDLSDFVIIIKFQEKNDMEDDCHNQINDCENRFVNGKCPFVKNRFKCTFGFYLVYVIYPIW